MVLFLLGGAWSLSTPLMSSPDEPSHTIKAASVVRGQFLGPKSPASIGATDVEVPALVSATSAFPQCYMFQPNFTAACALDLPEEPNETVDSVTTAGRYNPTYYAVVGLPSLMPASSGVLYMMRLFSAAFSAALLAIGVKHLAELRTRSWVTVGLAGALTPMTLFLSGTINPAGFEIAAAVGLWLTMLALFRDPRPELMRSRAIGTAVTGSFLVNARGLSPLYLLIIVAAVLAASRWRDIRTVFTSRVVWPWIGLLGLTSGFAAWWIISANSLATGTMQFPEYGFTMIAKDTLASTGVYVNNMIGQFGWMDTNLPSWLLQVFAAVILFTVAVALAVARSRERLVLAALAAAVVLVPVIIHAAQAKYIGWVWQGRYILPVAVGVPILAGYLAQRRAGLLPAWFLRRVVATLVIAAGLVQLLALVINLHRYVNGVGGPWLSLVDYAWIPPFPLALLLLLMVGATVLYTALMYAVGRPDRAADDESAAESAAESQPSPAAADPVR